MYENRVKRLKGCTNANKGADMEINVAKLKTICIRRQVTLLIKIKYVCTQFDNLQSI